MASQYFPFLILSNFPNLAISFDCLFFLEFQIFKLFKILVPRENDYLNAKVFTTLLINIFKQDKDKLNKLNIIFKIQQEIPDSRF